MNPEIMHEIKKFLQQKKFPDGTSYQSISVKNISALAKSFRLNGRLIEIAALEKEIVPERYARNMKLFSPADQAILLRSKVSVVGLGGLGGAVTEILARIGIGVLNLIDGDTFEDNNLNRQFLSEPGLLFQSKSKAAFNRVRKINLSLEVRNHSEYLDENNAGRLLDPSDVVVDCLDNLKTRFVLESAAKKIGSPLVTAAVAGAAGHVATIFPADPGLRLIYGDKDLVTPKGAEASLGCLPHAVTVLAALESSEVVKNLLNRGSVLRNRLLVIDLMDNTLEVLKLQ